MREKRFGTFVIRYWWLPDDEQRLDIEHVQSGERHRCASLGEAEEWLAARVRAGAAREAGSAGRVGDVPVQGDLSE